MELLSTCPLFKSRWYNRWLYGKRWRTSDVLLSEREFKSRSEAKVKGDTDASILDGVKIVKKK
jgi:hypothetical protein